MTTTMQTSLKIKVVYILTNIIGNNKNNLTNKSHATIPLQTNS
jgi:hypothetical protein